MAPEGEGAIERGARGARRPRAVLGLSGGPEAASGHLRPLGLDVVGVAASGPALLGAVAEQQPDVVLLHAHLGDANSDLPRYLQRRYGVPTILLVPARLHQPGVAEGDADRLPLFPLLRQNYPPALLAEAERVGCAFVAAWPPDPAELGMVVEQALARARVPAHGLVAPPLTTVAQTRGRVIAVWGLKGGVGKSALAVNLACGLGGQGGRHVLLVDLDVTNAALHRELGLVPSPEKGLGPFAAAVAARAKESPGERPFDLAPFVEAYRVPGARDERPILDLLVGLADLGARDSAGKDRAAARALLAAARGQYDEVVIDLGTTMSTEVHPRLAAEADLVLVVVTPSLIAVEGTAAVLASLTNAVSLNAERCRLVVNMVTSTVDQNTLSLAEIRRYFRGIEPLALLPDEPGLPRPAHTPWILVQERRTHQSALVRSLEGLINELAPQTFPRRPEGVWERARARVQGWRLARARPTVTDAPALEEGPARTEARRVPGGAEATGGAGPLTGADE